MAVTTFEEVQEALDAIQVQLAELLALINARPPREEISRMVSAITLEIETLRTQVQSEYDRVTSLQAAVTSTAKTLSDYIKLHP